MFDCWSILIIENVFLGILSDKLGEEMLFCVWFFFFVGDVKSVNYYYIKCFLFDNVNYLFLMLDFGMCNIGLV